MGTEQRKMNEWYEHEKGIGTLEQGITDWSWRIALSAAGRSLGYPLC
jgi:hypothetical protein